MKQFRTMPSKRSVRKDAKKDFNKGKRRLPSHSCRKEWTLTRFQEQQGSIERR
jgi:hypothetical protein